MTARSGETNTKFRGRFITLFGFVCKKDGLNENKEGKKMKDYVGDQRQNSIFLTILHF